MKYRNPALWHKSRPWKPSPALRLASKRSCDATSIVISLEQPDLTRDDQPKKDSASAFKHVARVISIVAQLATVLGLIMLYFQIKMLYDEIKLSAVGQVYTQMVEIDKLFVEQSEARLLVYGNVRWEDMHPTGNDDLRQKDQMKAMASAEMMMDFFGQVSQVWDKLDPNVQLDWKAYIQDVYKCSPEIQRTYERKREWYEHERGNEIITEAKWDMEYPTTRQLKCDSFNAKTY